MNEFGGQPTVCRKIARKGKRIAAAIVLSAALTACGGGDDSPGTPTASLGGQPGGAGSPTTPGAAPTSPGGSLGSSSGPPPVSDGAPSDSAGAPSDSGGAPTDDGAVPPSSGEGEGPGTGSVTLSWVPPTANDDGSPLKLTGYRIYWGPSDEDFTHSVVLENPGLTRYVVDQLTAGTWYFVATALSGDKESEYSNVFATTIN